MNIKISPQEEIPDSVIDSLARCLLPKLMDFFESPEGQVEFERWKQQGSKDIINKMTLTHEE